MKRLYALCLLLASCGLTAVALGQPSAAAATQAAVLSMESRITFGLLLGFGTAIGAAIGSWVSLRIGMARLEERIAGMCHTLDRHEQELCDLRTGGRRS